MKEVKVPFNAPLNELDTETQTFGCRQKNPNICGNNCMPDVCAFVREDNLCMKPSKAWKKKYKELKGDA